MFSGERMNLQVELLTPATYPEFDEFVAGHPASVFTQVTAWGKVKNNWGLEGVISRAADGKIKGALLVLTQKIPLIGTTFLYAARGPVCDLHDRETLDDLMSGVFVLAKKHRAHMFKWDPDVFASDAEFLNIMEDMGFKRFWGPEGFETIQARFNYRLEIAGRTEEEVMAAFHSKTRYNIRVAIKHGVEVRAEDKSALPEFMRLMRTTGERDGFNIRPQNYFERMLDALGDNVRLYMAYYDGKAVSGAITTNLGDKTCYVYGASDNVFRNVMPNYLVQWEMIKWAIERGCRIYDFQGVSGILDETQPIYGLYRFKKGFNGSLDELAGEFDYMFKPVMAKLVDRAIDLNAALRRVKNSLAGR